MRVMRILLSLYRLRFGVLRRLLIKGVLRLENGELYSQSLRDIFLRYHGISVGMYSYGGCFSPENVPPGTVIGRYCSFAKHIHILSGNHPTQFKSLHPFFYNPSLSVVDRLLIHRRSLKVGNDVWVGQNAIILPSVTEIGDGAVVGAGSVVTKNVPPYAIVVGNPARVIRYRFSPPTIARLLLESWWEKDIRDLKEGDLASFLRPIE